MDKFEMKTLANRARTVIGYGSFMPVRSAPAPH